MSRLWADRLYVSLEPEAMAICRVHGKKIISRTERTGFVEQLKDHLASLKNENLKVTVVLSNRLVRYALVPYDAGASTPEEEQARVFAKLKGMSGGDDKDDEENEDDEKAGDDAATDKE